MLDVDNNVEKVEPKLDSNCFGCILVSCGSEVVAADGVVVIVVDCATESCVADGTWTAICGTLVVICGSLVVSGNTVELIDRDLGDVGGILDVLMLVWIFFCFFG